MFTINSLLIRTDVTCVKIIESKVLAGIGGHLHIFQGNFKTPANIVQVFEGQKIYGIVPNSTYTQFLIYGGCKIKIFTCDLDKNINFQEITSFTCNDWILEAKWINCNTNIVTVLMHNIIVLWTKEMILIKTIICEEKCLLYSAYLVNDTWDNLIVLSGTVFSEVLIWWPKKSRNDDLCSVLHRLVGHKGVIFSIHYNSRAGIICSTSDDRSARLWSVAHKDLLTELLQSNIQISLKCTLYGHTARVFRCHVLEEYVLTAGEDSLVNIWDLDGKLIRKIEAHQGACVWGLDCDESNNLIATGGSDCGVTLFSLHQSSKKTELRVTNKDVPKRVAILKNNDIITITEKGLLKYYCIKQDSWTEICQYNDLISYALLEVSPCRKFIALAGYHGTIYIYKQVNSTLKQVCSYEVEGKYRIFAFHWLSHKSYLICGPEGLMSLWDLKEDFANCIKIFRLPPSKEPWTTAACAWDDKYIAVGDRKGNLYLYSLESTDPIHILKKAHNYLGITNLYCRKNELVSLGRNSVLKKYGFDDSVQQLSMLSSDKLPFTWLAAMYKTNETILLLSFFGDEFVLWDYKRRRTLLQFNCGGGHRSWDFHKNNSDINFVYIKDKHINLTQFCWDSLYPLDVVGGYHISEINSACCLYLAPNTRKCLFISGGEDTTLRISTLDVQNNFVDFTNTIVLKSHLSSIRVITSCVSSETSDEKFVGNYLVFSAGGRAQIILWELQANFEDNFDVDVICSEKFSYYEQTDDSEMRIMDLCTILINKYVVLIAACSDGILKVFVIAKESRSNYKIIFLENVVYKLKCILKVSYLKICNRHVVLSLATDGKITFWDFSKFICYLNNAGDSYKIINNEHALKKLLDLKPFYSIKIHQSGINSFSSKIINDNYCVFLSGGDDNAVSFNLFEFMIKNELLCVKMLSTFSDVSSHCAQITGTFLLENHFITTSIDQRLNIFEWKIVQEQVSCNYIQKHNSAVADIQGMQCFEKNKAIYAILYGKGVELCQCQINADIS